MEKMDVKKEQPASDHVPTSCKECFNSRFKLPKPQCAHEQGLEHKKTYEYFKTVYGVPIQQHLDAMHVLKRQRDLCIKQIQDQATQMIQMRRALDIDNILRHVVSLNERIETIEKNGMAEFSEAERILAAPKEQTSSEESITTKIIRVPSISKEVGRKVPVRNDEDISLKNRGWLMFVRNVKKEKIQEYLDKLKGDFPELTDKQIKVTVNKAGNNMIRYTLNPNLA
jgi:hypothetical protein